MHLELGWRTATLQGCRPHPALLPFPASECGTAWPWQEQRLAVSLHPLLLPSPPFSPLLRNRSKKAQLPNIKWRGQISVSALPVTPESQASLVHLNFESGGRKNLGRLTEWNAAPEPQTSSGLVKRPFQDKCWKDSGLAGLVSSTRSQWEERGKKDSPHCKTHCMCDSSGNTTGRYRWGAHPLFFSLIVLFQAWDTKCNYSVCLSSRMMQAVYLIHWGTWASLNGGMKSIYEV